MNELNTRWFELQKTTEQVVGFVGYEQTMEGRQFTVSFLTVDHAVADRIRKRPDYKIRAWRAREFMERMFYAKHRN